MGLSLLPIGTQVFWGEGGISQGEETCSPNLGTTLSSCKEGDVLVPPTGARDALSTSLPPLLPTQDVGSPAQSLQMPWAAAWMGTHG